MRGVAGIKSILWILAIVRGVYGVMGLTNPTDRLRELANPLSSSTTTLELSQLKVNLSINISKRMNLLIINHTRHGPAKICVPIFCLGVHIQRPDIGTIHIIEEANTASFSIKTRRH